MKDNIKTIKKTDNYQLAVDRFTIDNNYKKHKKNQDMIYRQFLLNEDYIKQNWTKLRKTLDPIDKKNKPQNIIGLIAHWLGYKYQPGVSLYYYVTDNAGWDLDFINKITLAKTFHNILTIIKE